MVEESSKGNCPVCVDPFQIGDQVPPSCQSFSKCYVLQLLLPGCAASKQHACHPACLQGWLARFTTCTTFSSSPYSLRHSSTLNPPLLRHSTCPVCRQTLAIEEEEEGYDGGDENEEGE